MKTKRQRRAYANAYYASNRDKLRAQANARLTRYRKADPHYNAARGYKTRFGLDLMTLRALFHKQKKRCAICRKALAFPSRTTHVDHCHKSGVVRGILCIPCNMMLGMAKDKPKLLLAAVEYLR